MMQRWNGLKSAVLVMGIVAAVALMRPAMQAQAAKPLPMPTFHHIHLNAVDPERSLAWYAKYWPKGKKTTYGGFPAFQDDIYLLYNKVPKRAQIGRAHV